MPIGWSCLTYNVDRNTLFPYTALRASEPKVVSVPRFLSITNVKHVAVCESAVQSLGYHKSNLTK